MSVKKNLPVLSWQRLDGAWRAFSIDGLLIGSLFLAFVIVGGLWMASMGWIDPDDDINIGLNMDNWYSVLILAVYFATKPLLDRRATHDKIAETIVIREHKKP